MATIKMTVVESGFCNVADRTYVGDVYEDEPGRPANHLFRVTVPDWCKRGFSYGGCVILVDAKGQDRGVVTGDAEGRFGMILDNHIYDSITLKAERLI